MPRRYPSTAETLATLDAFTRAYPAPKAYRYLAKCRACGIVTSGLTSGQNMRREKSDPQRTGDVYTYYQPRGEAPEATIGGFVLDCRGCRKPRNAVAVRGKFSAKHVCSARCTSSTGTVCECSCAGKNHGSMYQR